MRKIHKLVKKSRKKSQTSVKKAQQVNLGDKKLQISEKKVTKMQI